MKFDAKLFFVMMHHVNKNFHSEKLDQVPLMYDHQYKEEHSSSPNIIEQKVVHCYYGNQQKSFLWLQRCVIKNGMIFGICWNDNISIDKGCKYWIVYVNIAFVVIEMKQEQQ